MIKMLMIEAKPLSVMVKRQKIYSGQAMLVKALAMTLLMAMSRLAPMTMA